MLSHDAIWQAIDRLAKKHNLSPSGLARMAGLDATVFNPSKRIKSDGRPRWPSTESISKILQVTNTSPWLFFLPPFEELEITVASDRAPVGSAMRETKSLDMVKNWDEEKRFASKRASSSLQLIELGHSDLSPLYDQGDLLLICIDWPLEANDMVAIYPIDGKMMIYRFREEGLTHLHLTDSMGDQKRLLLQKSQLSWWAKILWVAK